jgi:hypothetical protein
LENFQSIPTILRNEIIFEKAFEKAELANLDSVQSEAYERSLKDFGDLKGMFDYANQNAFDKGKIERNIEVAKSLKDADVSIDIICKSTGLFCRRGKQAVKQIALLPVYFISCTHLNPTVAFLSNPWLTLNRYCR